MKTITLIAVLALSLSANAQQLTLDQIKKLDGLPLEEASTFLEGKGWKFYKITQRQSPTEYNAMVFRHSRTNVDLPEEAPHWVRLYYIRENVERIAYVTVEQTYFEAVKNSVKASGMQMDGQTTEDGTLRQLYSNSTHQISLTRASAKDGYKASYRMVFNTLK